MAKYTYVQGTGKIVEFLNKLGTVGKPSVVDKDWMARIGYGTSNDLTFVRMLKDLGYVGADGAPTERWSSLRNDDLKHKVLTEAIREHYSELYAVHPDAHSQDAGRLSAFFKADTDVGPGAVALVVNTFKALCVVAALTDNPPPSPKPSRTVRTPRTTAVVGRSSKGIRQSVAEPEVPTSPPTAGVTSPSAGGGAVASGIQSTGLPTPGVPLGVHINIELHLPATTDAEVYDKLFGALRRHLLTNNE